MGLIKSNAVAKTAIPSATDTASPKCFYRSFLANDSLESNPDT